MSAPPRRSPRAASAADAAPGVEAGAAPAGSPSAKALLHPMKVVVRRTGLTPDVVRVWERRHGAVEPVRSPGNRRLYSDADLERLVLLARATRLGRSIGQVAGLPLDRLRELVERDSSAGPEVAPQSRADASRGALAGDAEEHLHAVLDAVRALDADGIERALAGAVLALGRLSAIEGVIVPLLHRIGELWREGKLGVAHEHVASAMVRTVLVQMRLPVLLADGGPVLVVATPPRQVHELGALLVAIEAESSGFHVLYLGADIPAEDIAHAALQTGARAVALSLVYPPDDPRLPGQIERLSRLLPAGTTLLVGGAAAPAYGEALARSRAVLVGDLADLRPRLDELRRGAPGRGARAR